MPLQYNIAYNPQKCVIVSFTNATTTILLFNNYQPLTRYALRNYHKVA
jgi:hypothetical protein